jgi:UDP-glucose 4-epimerase
VLIADSSRIRNQLGWQPRYENIRDIIQSAWEWHRKEAG